MAATKTQTWTIGYAGRNAPEFVKVLTAAGVDLVIDVRALPLSRKKGFSKTALGESLRAAGIEYLHLRRAGNPYRDQKHDVERCLHLYGQHLDASPDVVAEVEAAVRGRKAALLCFEAEAGECHRSVLLERILARDSKRTAVHLLVEAG